MAIMRGTQKNITLLFTICAALLCLLMAPWATGQSVTATSPYTVSVFAMGVPAAYTQPDSIAFTNDRIFIGYGNGIATDGSDGKTSTIVEYRMEGTIVTTFKVLGHNDGLKIEPQSGMLWAMQNEDANPSLAIIDPATGSQSVFTVQAPHGGGYDDIVFSNGEVYFSASNPKLTPQGLNTFPAIVRATLIGPSFFVSPVLLGDAKATDTVTGNEISLNLTDPDSMILDPQGDLVLDSQGDDELVIVHNPGNNPGSPQDVSRLSLTSSPGPTEVDDTIFATSIHGQILVADRNANGKVGIVYSITRPTFSPGAAYSAEDVAGAVGKLDLDTGVLTPIITGLSSPHGMAFVPAP